MRTPPKIAPKELLSAKDRIDARLKHFFATRKKELSKDTELLSYYKMLEEFCLRGGKRFRGYLVLLGYRIAGKTPTPAILDVACAIELLHTGLLIHDDIIDSDTTRRGKPTLHVMLTKKLGNASLAAQVAKNLGTLLFDDALRLILDANFSDDQKIACAKIIAETSLSTGFGEVMDIVLSHKDISSATVEKILLLKTARYSVSQPLTTGYILGNGKVLTKILRFSADALGIAFQIRDDSLGVMGKKLYQGKASDIREKRPFVYMPLMKKYLTKLEMLYVYGVSAKKQLTKQDLDALKRLFHKPAFERTVQKRAARYLLKAERGFRRILPSKLQKEMNQVIHFVFNREE